MIPKPTEITLRREPFYLLPQKAVFRPLQRQLILSDLHLGKTSHLRTQGLTLPSQSHLRDVDKLHFLLDKLEPETALILGDLFYNQHNREWLWFKSLLMHYPDVQFILLEGSNDVLPRNSHAVPNLIRIGQLEEQQFIFSHHPLHDQEKFNICGHVHPGLRVIGQTKQSLSMPCFSVSDTHLILPAFGERTELHLLDREAAARYFLVTNNEVISV